MHHRIRCNPESGKVINIHKPLYIFYMSKITVYDCAVDEEMNEAEKFLRTGREILKMEIILLPHLLIISSDKPARYKPENE